MSKKKILNSALGPGSYSSVVKYLPSMSGFNSKKKKIQFSFILNFYYNVFHFVECFLFIKDS
jgi:hypothetical protein